jgi:hypothetical protein
MNGLHLVGLHPLVELLEQVPVVAFFDPQDEVAAAIQQVADVRRVGTQGVLGDDDWQVRVVLAEPFQPATGGIGHPKGRAVVLGLAVLHLDRLGGQGDDFREVRVDEDRAEHLVVVGNVAVLVMAGHAVVAVDLVGAEVFDAIEGHQVAAIEEDILLQHLAALELAEDVLEDGAELVGMNVVEDLAHLGVAGDAVQAEDRTEVVVEGTGTEGKERGILEGKEGEAGQQGVGQGE